MSMGARLTLVASLAVVRRAKIGRVRRSQQAGRLRERAGDRLAPRQPTVAAVHGVEMRRRAVDMQLENVGPVVVAGEVMPELGQDAEIEVAVGVKNPLFGAHR